MELGSFATETILTSTLRNVLVAREDEYEGCRHIMRLYCALMTAACTQGRRAGCSQSPCMNKDPKK